MNVQLLEQALGFHQRGQLAQAEQLYTQILQAQPDHFDVLHMLGVVRLEQGRYDEALNLIAAALKINPQSPRAHANYGQALYQAQRYAQALASFDRALEIQPKYPEALHARGNVLAQLGRYAEALASFERALALRPDDVEALFGRGNALGALQRYAEALACFERIVAIDPAYAEVFLSRGNVLSGLGRHEEALASYDRALALRPDYADALYGRGRALQTLKRHQEALASYDKALSIRPDFAEALNNRGSVLSEMKRYDEALASFDKASALRPDNADVLNNRGNTLSAMGRYEEALAIYDRALALKPEFADALYNRGQALTWLDRHQEALESYDRSLAINPDNADALTNRGNTLQALNRYEEAVPCFERALALRPDQPEGHWNLALGLLAVCKFAEGWKEYEWRWKLPKSRSNLPVNACARRFLPQPSWTGRQVDGTLLVWGEQGLGDQILYASMLPDLASRAQSILVEIEPRLIPLFERSFAKVRAIGFGEKFDEADVKAQVGLASLGIFLRPSLESFPQRAGGFLKADPEMTASLRRRLSNTGKVVMGVSWISQNPRVGKFKTALLRDFEALLRLPGIRAIDLQYGDTLAERQTFEQETGVRVERLEDIDNTNDLDKLAALIAACDLVVTVSNTTAHLAGALGTPAWVFAPKAHGKFWYWFKDRPDSPWYPSVRIERQKIDQSWAEAIAAAVGEISAFLNAVQHSRIS